MTASTADRPPSTVQAEGQLILEPLTPPCAARRRSYTATGDSFAWSSPAVANGVLYLGSNHVYAFGLPGGVRAVSRPASRPLHPNYALRPQHSTNSWPAWTLP